MYGDLRRYSEGLAAVRVDGKFGFIDLDGNFMIEPQFSDAGIEPAPNFGGDCDACKYLLGKK